MPIMNRASFPSRHPRGFTVLVSPVDGDSNSHECYMQGAWCSPKDQFSKKEGRSYALKSEAVKVNKRQLPFILANMAEHARLTNQATDSSWYYVLKYVV
jgi:hypothetical protein